MAANETLSFIKVGALCEHMYKCVVYKCRATTGRNKNNNLAYLEMNSQKQTKCTERGINKHVAVRSAFASPFSVNPNLLSILAGNSKKDVPRCAHR